jgi:hypothetical protein
LCLFVFSTRQKSEDKWGFVRRVFENEKDKRTKRAQRARNLSFFLSFLKFSAEKGGQIGVDAVDKLKMSPCFFVFLFFQKFSAHP